MHHVPPVAQRRTWAQYRGPCAACQAIIVDP
jgi:hypothetical protein